MKMKSYNSYCKAAFAFLLFASLIVSFVSSCSHFENDDFNYDEGTGRGPSRWGTLEPQWRRCSVARQQSPIDIGTVRLRARLGDWRSYYTPAPAVLKNATHVVQVVWQGNAGRINIDGTNYNVTNVHWHSPSEHTFNGTRYDLELHLVHEIGLNKFAVVSMLYRVGLPDPFLTRLFPFIKTLGEEDRPVGSVNPESIGYMRGSCYRYMGSLTVPPCTEGVSWTVFHQVRTVSRQQLEALRNVLPPENRNNARPIQPLNGRPVFLYDPKW